MVAEVCLGESVFSQSSMKNFTTTENSQIRTRPMILYFPHILNFNVWSCKASLALRLVLMKSLVSIIKWYKDDSGRFLTSGYSQASGENWPVDRGLSSVVTSWREYEEEGGGFRVCASPCCKLPSAEWGQVRVSLKGVPDALISAQSPSAGASPGADEHWCPWCQRLSGDLHRCPPHSPLHGATPCFSDCVRNHSVVPEVFLLPSLHF